MSKPHQLLLGIDGGNESHYVYAINPAGTRIFHGPVAHRPDAIAAFLDRLRKHVFSLDEVVAGLEAPYAGLVDALMEAGVTVMTINPKQVDRFRDRHTLSGAKDDPRDAFVLADALRTDLAKFRRLEPLPDQLAALREYCRDATRTRDDLNQLTNRLYDKVKSLYPSLLTLSPGMTDAWVWDLLVRLNPHQYKRRAGKKTIASLLHHHHIRRFSVEQVLEVIREGELVLNAGRQQAAWTSITELVCRLRPLKQLHRQQEQRIRLLVLQVSKQSTNAGRLVRLIITLPGMGAKSTAVLISEEYYMLHTCNLKLLRNQVGVAPVTRRSGKSRYMVIMRRACNRFLRNMMYWVGMNAIRLDPKTRQYYNDLRQRGKNHAHSLRMVGDRMLRILMAMLKNGKPYDPQKIKRNGKQLQQPEQNNQNRAA